MWNQCMNCHYEDDGIRARCPGCGQVFSADHPAWLELNEAEHLMIKYLKPIDADYVLDFYLWFHKLHFLSQFNLGYSGKWK